MTKGYLLISFLFLFFGCRKQLDAVEACAVQYQHPSFVSWESERQCNNGDVMYERIATKILVLKGTDQLIFITPTTGLIDEPSEIEVELDLNVTNCTVSGRTTTDPTNGLYNEIVLNGSIINDAPVFDLEITIKKVSDDEVISQDFCSLKLIR